MTNLSTGAATRPLRLWPGVLAASLIVLLRFVVPVFAPDLLIVGVIAAAAGAVLIALWWLLFSRAPWVERVGALLVLTAAVLAIKPFLHTSIATGMMGRMFYFYAVPSVLAPAFVVWAVATRGMAAAARWLSLAVVAVLACAAWTAFRTDGITGGAGVQLQWRWTPTAEERLLARKEAEPAPPAAVPPPVVAAAPAAANEAVTESKPAPVAAPRAAAEPVIKDKAPAPAPAPAVASRPEWPGFRGSQRDSIVHGAQIETDWAAKPPVELWRRPVGPGWSSFAVQGDVLYTQEQRGEEELVAAYRVSTGAPVWRHRDRVRFWESNGGAGPRGTPTLYGGRVYSLGATGILNVLDAATGALIWTRNVGTDAAKKVPMWGFASSPLITGDMVVVAAAGRLAAYDLASGKPRWLGPNGGGGYSSPQLATIGGVPQIVFLSGAGATGVDPADGKPLWTYAWEGTPIVQPALTPEGDVLVTSGDAMGGMGMRRLSIAHASGGWKVEERWTSNGLKPYFNDFVVHKGHAFGFDGRILSCIDLSDGTRKWKGGRFGQGQLMLLPDEDLLLVISEEGELALVSATADKFTEIARFQALDGKTWNHPVLVNGTVLVRNDQEMAAFRLAALHDPQAPQGSRTPASPK